MEFATISSVPKVCASVSGSAHSAEHPVGGRRQGEEELGQSGAPDRLPHSCACRSLRLLWPLHPPKVLLGSQLAETLHCHKSQLPILSWLKNPPLAKCFISCFHKKIGKKLFFFPPQN